MKIKNAEVEIHWFTETDAFPLFLMFCYERKSGWSGKGAGRTLRSLVYCDDLSGKFTRRILKGVLSSIQNLMRTMGWSEDEAMKALYIPESDRKQYKEALNREKDDSIAVACIHMVCMKEDT